MWNTNSKWCIMNSRRVDICFRSNERMFFSMKNDWKHIDSVKYTLFTLFWLKWFTQRAHTYCAIKITTRTSKFRKHYLDIVKIVLRFYWFCTIKLIWIQRKKNIVRMKKGECFFSLQHSEFPSIRKQIYMFFFIDESASSPQ